MVSLTQCRHQSAMDTYFCCIILIFIPTILAYGEPKVYLPFANPYIPDIHRVETRSARRYCGSEITRTLTFLCESYNKRSSYSLNSDQDSDLNGELEEPNDRSRYSLALVRILGSAHNMKYFQRQVRGVVDDCCKRSCTTKQMAQYCDVVRIATTTPAAD